MSFGSRSSVPVLNSCQLRRQRFHLCAIAQPVAHAASLPLPRCPFRGSLLQDPIDAAAEDILNAVTGSSSVDNRYNLVASAALAIAVMGEVLTWGPLASRHAISRAQLVQCCRRNGRALQAWLTVLQVRFDCALVAVVNVAVTMLTVQERPLMAVCVSARVERAQTGCCRSLLLAAINFKSLILNHLVTTTCGIARAPQACFSNCAGLGVFSTGVARRPAPLSKRISYILFWVAVLAVKGAFDYFLVVTYLVQVTDAVYRFDSSTEQFDFVFASVNDTHNLALLAALWIGAIPVVFINTQIFYVVIVNFLAAGVGMWRRVGEVRTPCVATPVSVLPCWPRCVVAAQ
jgi:hypothetical protein